MADRKHITLTTKLAAALLTLRRPDEQGRLVPAIPHEHAKLMTAEQIISLFQWHHHPIPHEAGGPDEPWNLEPLFIREHRTETAVVTVPTITKIRHVSKTEEEFRRRLLAKDAGEPRRASKWPSRPMRWKGKRG